MTLLDPEVAPVLRHWHVGDWVVYLQTLLVAAGTDPGTIDGKFGRRTRTAVRQFQGAHRCHVDGAVGPETWKALKPFADTQSTPPPYGSALSTFGGTGDSEGPDVTSAVSTAERCDDNGLAHRVQVVNGTGDSVTVTGVLLRVGVASISMSQDYQSTEHRVLGPGEAHTYTFDVALGRATGEPYLVYCNAHANWTDGDGAPHTGSVAAHSYTVDGHGVVGGSAPAATVPAPAASAAVLTPSITVDNQCSGGELAHHVSMTNTSGVAIRATVAHLHVSAGGASLDFSDSRAQEVTPGAECRYSLSVPMGPSDGDPYQVKTTAWIDYTTPDGTAHHSATNSGDYSVDSAGRVTT